MKASYTSFLLAMLTIIAPVFPVPPVIATDDPPNRLLVTFVNGETQEIINPKFIYLWQTREDLVKYLGNIPTQETMSNEFHYKTKEKGVVFDKIASPTDVRFVRFERSIVDVPYTLKSVILTLRNDTEISLHFGKDTRLTEEGYLSSSFLQGKSSDSSPSDLHICGIRIEGQASIHGETHAFVAVVYSEVIVSWSGDLIKEIAFIK